MIKVIINADDLGKNTSVNCSIAAALSDRHISSSTIMANSDLWDEIHVIIDNNPQASFGIHLNLTEGVSLTNSPIFHRNGLVDESGLFTRKILSTINVSQDILRAVYEEWDAQLDKVINKEHVSLSHIDGHHHVHALYPFRSILLDLSKRYSIKCVRNRYTNISLNHSFLRHLASKTINHFADITGFPSTRSNILRKNRETKSWRELLQSNSLTTDLFSSYESFIMYLKNGFFPADGMTIELMCHPGHPRYALEYELIEKHELQNILPNIQVINFNQLN